MGIQRSVKKAASYMLYGCTFLVAVYYIWTGQHFIKLGAQPTKENREYAHEKWTNNYSPSVKVSNRKFSDVLFSDLSRMTGGLNVTADKLTTDTQQTYIDGVNVTNKDSEKIKDETSLPFSKYHPDISKQEHTNFKDIYAGDDLDDDTIPIVYDEYKLLARIKEVHDSRYDPPANEACESRMPQCVILGMRKCGTQELIDFLSLHSNIVRRGKPVYEINCFLSDTRFRTCESKNKMPCSYSDQITISKSSIYFTTPGVAERLFRYNSTLKMILLVREPVERLIADYSFEFFQKHGKKQTKHSENSSLVYSEMKSLDTKLLNMETGRIKPLVPEVVRSTYDVAMYEYLKYFKREQILIIEAKELKESPINVLRKVETFLGLEHAIEDNDFVFNQEKGFYCLRNDGHMNCYGDNRGRSKSAVIISKNTKRRLTLFFRKHNEMFFKLIGKRYDW